MSFDWTIETKLVEFIRTLWCNLPANKRRVRVKETAVSNLRGIDGIYRQKKSVRYAFSQIQFKTEQKP